MGIAVPEQLAICGFGDFELSRSGEPPFTTVSVDGAAMGGWRRSICWRAWPGPAGAAARACSRSDRGARFHLTDVSPVPLMVSIS